MLKFNLISPFPGPFLFNQHQYNHLLFVLLVEDYYKTEVPFDYLWLREQILSGGGKVYKSLLDVDKEDYRNTLVIADNIFETPNYLLALSLGIPIYRHDLIVNCCIQASCFYVYHCFLTFQNTT